jgi:hypothetical protein
MYADLSGFKLAGAPGTIFDYSNYGFGLLGDLLARGAGRADYEALLLERITRPLGMDNTRIQMTPEMQSRLAAPHNDDLLPGCEDARSAFAGSGGIRSTANDMLTFLAANLELTNTELQPALRLANTPQRPAPGGGSIGLGWQIQGINEVHLHNGRTGGYYSYLAWDPRRRIGVVMLTNATNGIDDEAFQLILGITSGRPVPRNIEILLAAWAVITAGCLAFLIWELWSRRPAPSGARLMWLLTTVFMGPIGLVIYWISTGQLQQSGVSAGQVSTVRRALGSAAWAATGNVLGGIGVLALQRYFPNVVGANLVFTIAASLLLPLFAGWLIFTISRWISRSEAGHDHYSRRPLFVEVASACLVLAGLFPTVDIIIMRWLNLWTNPSGWDLSYPPLWGALCLGAIVGTPIAYPFHLWMLRRGEFRWGNEATSDAVSIRRLVWYLQVALVVLSFAIMLGAMFLAMQIV